MGTAASGRGVTDVERFKALRSQDVREWPAMATRAWDMPSARTAAIKGQAGNFQLISDMARAMTNDPTYFTVRERRINGFLRSDVAIIPANDSVLAEEIADNLRDYLPQMFRELELRKLLGWYHDVSVAPATLDWELSDDGLCFLPCLRVLNPRWVYYDPSRNWFVFEGRDNMADMHPGDGRWVLLTDWEPTKFCGKASACASAWVAKRFTEADWNTWRDNNCNKIIKAKYPNGGDNDASQSEDSVTSFSDRVSQARLTKVIGLPQGQDPSNSFDIDAVNLADPTAGASYPTALEYYDRKMAEAWLGSHLAFEVTDRGSYAAAETHGGVTRELVQGDAKMMEEVLNLQIVYPFTVANYGEGLAATCCPKLKWKIDVEEDFAGVTKAFQTFCAGLKQAADAGYAVKNLDQLGTRFGFQFERIAAPTGTSSPQAPPAPLNEPTDDTQKNDRSLDRGAPRTIKKISEGRWRVFGAQRGADGKRINLGTFSSYEEAKRHEAQAA